MNEIFNKLKFNQDGLIPVITQEINTREILMQAWMNLESLKITIDTSIATYYSRSRQELWQKGKTSGNMQQVVRITADCDYDCILLEVLQTGNA
ncbi:MAG: phosphoribosyl-AMP cyclohydrolase, partial [Alphaproteobacteria bacterium]